MKTLEDLTMTILDQTRKNGSITQERIAKARWFNRIYKQKIDISPRVYETLPYDPEVQKLFEEYKKGEIK